MWNSAPNSPAIATAATYHHSGARSDSRYVACAASVRGPSMPSVTTTRVASAAVTTAPDAAGAGAGAGAGPGPTVLVRRIDPGVPLPLYALPGDAGADIVTAADVTLEPGERAVLPTGLAIAL